MAVGQVDILGITVFDTKSHPPVSRNPNAPVSLEISLQQVEPVAGQVGIRGDSGVVRVCQRQGDAVGRVWNYHARIAAFVQTIETLMTEAPEHPEHAVACRVPVGIVP